MTESKDRFCCEEMLAGLMKDEKLKKMMNGYFENKAGCSCAEYMERFKNARGEKSEKKQGEEHEE